VSFPLDPPDTVERYDIHPAPNGVPARKVREAETLIHHLLNPAQ